MTKQLLCGSDFLITLWIALIKKIYSHVEVVCFSIFLWTATLWLRLSGYYSIDQNSQNLGVIRTQISVRASHLETQTPQLLESQLSCLLHLPVDQGT